MLKWLKRKKIPTIHLRAGDTISMLYTDEKGREHTACKSQIGRTMTINEAAVFTFKDEFGMREGVGGVFGEAK